MKSLAAIAIAAVTIVALTPPANAAIAAGAGIEVNGKYIGGFTITWDGETREHLVQQLSKRYITFERDYKIPISAKDPNVAAINGRIRLLSKIRGDRQVMGRTQALQLVKRDGKWFVERESLKRALKADNGDETLERWLTKSDLVVVGTIVSDPVAILGEKGVPHYACRFKASDVCKGDDGLIGKALDLGIVRFEIEEKDHHPLINKDAECILFLRNTGTEKEPSWETADFWFGVQHPFPWMVDSLKRLEKRKQGVYKQDSNISNHPRDSRSVMAML